MKIFNKVLIATLSIAFVFGFVGLNNVAHAATNPNLGAADTFSVLASTLITGTTLTALNGISGDVGLNAAGSPVSITALTTAMVAGTIYSTDGVAPSEAILPVSVQGDAATARAAILPGGGLADEGGAAVPLELGGVTRGPGVYTIAGNATLSGVLTLDGAGTYIFRNGPGFDLTSGVGGSINFINGARACDLFWGIGTAANIGGSFAGTILSSTGVHFTTAGTTLNGRALTVGADVSLNTTDISGPSCAVPATPPTCTLSASPTTIVSGNSSTLSWTTTDATSFTIDNSVGSVTPVASGTNVVLPITTTTYTGTATGAGGSVDCTATVTVTAPPTTENITLTKIVIGGSNAIADFSLFINSVAFPGGSGSTNPFTAPATYTVTETSNSNYSATYSGDCPAGIISLTLGTPKACIITNTYSAPSSGGGGSRSFVPPLIDVVKVPSPLALPNGPGPVTYTYTLSNIGTVPVTNITMVGDTCSPIVLVSGDTNNDAKLDLAEKWIYRCSTTLAATHTNTVTTTGWANGISAVDIANATVVVGASVVPPLIHVTKVPSPLALIGGGAVTYKYTVTNPGTVPLNNVFITDDKCTGLPGRVLGHPGDLNKNNLLESNESWSFTCKSNLTKTTTNTATASGSANGLTARDFAIATVVVSIPGLPKTGFSIENSYLEIISIIGGLFVILISLYILKKKQII